MAKITDYSAASVFDSGDVIIKDGTNGTKKMAVADAARGFAESFSATIRRSIYRGKNLGTSITAAQKAAIQNGTFTDMFVGDYWVINGRTFVIADFDYWYNCGDTAFTKHHLVITVLSPLYNHVMNDTNTTEGGYVGSKMRTSGLDNARQIFQEAFGDMLLTHREYLTNAVTNGCASGGGWFDSDVDLPNQIMMHGHDIFSPRPDGSTIPNLYTICKTQLAIFMLRPDLITQRVNKWLRDVVSSSYFAFVDGSGGPDYFHASTSYGVCPVAAIGA